MAEWLQAGLLAVNIPMFTVLATRAMLSARRERSPRFRSLLYSFGLLALIAVAGSLLHLGTLAEDAEVVTGGGIEVSLAVIQGVAALLAVAGGVLALQAYRRAKGPLGRSEMVFVANSGVPLKTPVAELGLTARELEVLEALLAGSITDAEIAESLYVSPSTAGSHVTSLMAKAAVSSRRQLLALLPPEQR